MGGKGGGAAGAEREPGGGEQAARFHAEEAREVIDDPDERLYDVMISIATKAMGRTQIAATLRLLVAPVSD